MPGKYKQKNGTTRVGDALRWLVSNGKKVAPELLDIAGNITGIEGLKNLSDKIKNDGQLSEADKEMLLAELNFDMIEMQEITKRWVSDNSASWWTKNIRPMTLAFLTITLFIYIILDSSIAGFEIDDQWVDLLSSVLLLVYGGYFGARSAEKIVKEWKNGKN